MTIDIEGVGNDMLSVPIKADCQVPNVDISPAEKVEFFNILGAHRARMVFFLQQLLPTFLAVKNMTTCI